MVDIASRKSWGAKHDDGDLTLSGLATNVVVHHTTTHVEGSTVEAERAHMRYLETIGEGRFGRGISYNVLVFPSGRAYQGVSFNRRGTHTGGHNSTRRSVCFVGNFENEEPTKAALEAGRAIIAEGRGRWWRKAAPVEGHRDYTATACPGRNLYDHLGYLASGKALAKPAEPLPAPGKLVVDGQLGRATVAALQRELGTTADGRLSSQPYAHRDRLPTVHGGAVQFWPRPSGSRAVAALQRKLGVTPDGLLGPTTLTTWQRKLGVKPDGYFGEVSTEALQRALNAGKLW
jgi:peptidoglycan hydrolase-like protein with peptidoglycan-binding domain